MNKQHLALSLSVGVLGGISLILATAFTHYIVWVGFVVGLFLRTVETVL